MMSRNYSVIKDIALTSVAFIWFFTDNPITDVPILTSKH